MTQRVKINDRYKGIFYIILAAFGFAFMNLFVKLAGDLPAIEKSFFRNLVAIFFAIIFSYFLLKEKIKPYQLICVIVAFIGALFILRPGFDSVATFPAFIGLIGGMGAGLAYTNVRIASKHGVPGPLIVFCFSVFSCVCAIPFIIWNPQPLAWWQLGSLLMAGLSATLGQFSITAAYTYAPASELSVYDYTQIVFAALLGMIFLGEVPDMISILGYFIICGAGVAMFLIRRKKETKLE